MHLKADPAGDWNAAFLNESDGGHAIEPKQKLRAICHNDDLIPVVWPGYLLNHVSRGNRKESIRSGAIRVSRGIRSKFVE